MKRPIDIISRSKHSLVHIGSLDSFDLTKGGIEAAANIMRYFETQDKKFLKEAVYIYETLIPTENFGGEYTALRWICNLLMAPSPEEAKTFLNEPSVVSWYEYLRENDYKKLKEYINYKYHFLEVSHDTDEGREAGRNLRFLEDFILFSNPDRERWEQTEQILNQLRIAPGLTIADVGCGSGYFTFKFADMVGPDGKIYGIEINPMHLEYLRRYVDNNNIKNVEIVESTTNGIGLNPDVHVDVVFSCSLFHVLYAVFDDDSRRSFLESISNALVQGGALIVMDNDLVDEGDLPYHGPYIAKDLLISQLYYYGFNLVKTVQITKQRYALSFEKSDMRPIENSDMSNIQNGMITATDDGSLVNYALADAAPIIKYTENGKKAAELLLQALIDKQAGSIDAAVAAYEKIIPTERIGDEYTAFVWFCEYLKADDQKRGRLISDLLVKEYYDYLSKDDYILLKRYLIMRYELAGYSDIAPDRNAGQSTDSAHDVDDIDDMININEYIAFNNPARERWEKTSLMLDMVGAKPGETVADVGCGSGYFTYKFAKMVGSSGKVYATELNEAALSYVEKMRDRYSLNITPIVSAMNDVKLPAGEFDKIFMCSMYHAVYVSSIEFVKDAFIDSIKAALKDDGKLIIVDNDVKRKGIPAYYGSAIDRRLIISQLTHYGFRLIEEKQFIPQRYVLIFQKQ